MLTPKVDCRIRQHVVVLEYCITVGSTIRSGGTRWSDSGVDATSSLALAVLNAVKPVQ